MKYMKSHLKFYSWIPGLKMTRVEAKTINLFLFKQGFKFIIKTDINMLSNSCILSYVEDSSEFDWKKEFDWMEENMMDKWAYYTVPSFSYFYFQNKEDTLKFILKFGCRELEQLKELE